MIPDIRGAIFDSSPIGIAVVNLQSKLVNANDSLCRILLYTKEELQALTFIDITYPEDIEKDTELFKKLTSKEIPFYKLEKRFIRKDGEIIWANISVSAVVSRKNGETFAIKYLEEITNQKQTEQELKDSESLFKNLFEYAPDGMYVHDLEGKLIDGNKAAEMITGYNREELIGTNILKSELVTAQYREVVLDSIKKIKHKKDFGPEEIVLKRKDGTYVTIEARTIPLKIKGRIYALGIARDISERKASLEKISKQKEQLEAIVKASPLPIISVDIDYIVELWNPAAEKVFGWTESETLGKKYPLVPKDRVKEHNDLINELLDKKLIKDKELIRQKKDGSLVAITASIAVKINEDGKADGFMIIYTDLTDKKISESKNNAMFKTMAQGVVYQDNEGKIINANPAAERILGVSLKEMTGRLSGDVRWKAIKEDGSIFPGDTHPAMISLNKGKEVYNTTMGIFNPQKKGYRWLNVHAIPLFKPGAEKPFQVYSTFEDVTEIREILNALRAAEQKNRAILDSIPDLIFVLSREGVLLNYKSNNKNRLFLSPENLINKNIRDVFPHNISAITFEKIETAIKTGEVQSFEYNLPVNGQIAYNEARISISGKNETLMIIRDITEKVKTSLELNAYKKHLETLVQRRTNELKSLNQQLKIEIKKKENAEKQTLKALEKEKELNELKSRFVSMASHEFRTPLTSIKIFTDLLKMYGEKVSEEKFHNCVSKIHGSVNHMTVLIDDVLTVSRTDTGKLKYEPVKTNLYELCAQIAEENKIYLTNSHNFHLEFNCDRQEFIIDEKLTKQTLSNILSNAIKYSPGGGNILFRVDSKDSNIIFKVTDEGIGIVLGDKNKVFESFYRGENIGTIPGTGLGLTIVKKLVDIQKGEIHIKSNKGKGTSFIVMIPEARVTCYEQTIIN